MCLAIVSTRDHLAIMELDDIRSKEERDDRDRLELRANTKVEEEKGKRRGMRNGLISSGGDLTLNESGRNLGTETGSRPSVPEAPDYSPVAPETIARQHQTIKQSSASPVPCGYCCLFLADVRLY